MQRYHFKVQARSETCRFFFSLFWSEGVQFEQSGVQSELSNNVPDAAVSGGAELRERGEEIRTALLCSHALVQMTLFWTKTRQAELKQQTAFICASPLMSA